MSEFRSPISLQLWEEGPQICILDPLGTPNYSIQAACAHPGCEEIFPFQMGLAKDMRKHYNEKHLQLCKACKSENFRSKDDLEGHLKSVHEDSYCLECHASFTLTSAIAMHIENANIACWVRPQALARALRRIHADEKDLERQKYEIDQNTVHSPISCGLNDISRAPSDGIMFRKLKEFRRTLLRAHKEALIHKRQLQEDNHPASLPVSAAASMLNSGRLHNSYVVTPGNDPILQSGPGYVVTVPSYDQVMPPNPRRHGSGHGKGLAYTVQLPTSSSSEDSNFKPPCASGSNDSPGDQNHEKWECATCSIKFTTLSKLLQHVESRVKDSWWKFMNK